MIKKMFTTLTLLLLIGAAVAYWGYQRVLALPEQSLGVSEPSVLEVPRGTSAYQLALILEQRGWIDDSRWLRALFKLRPELTALKAGEYQVMAEDRLIDLLERINRGEAIQYRVTLIEGSTVPEMLRSLRQTDVLKSELQAQSAVELAAELELAHSSAEGLFLAETYQFERGMSDRDLLLRAHQMLLDVLDKHWQSRDPDLPLKSPYEALTLASIIEKETGLSSERPDIAGVFIRRLNLGMRLQTDPTVIYGMGERYNGNLTRKDLREKTDFNTYVIKGLPPTPIATVGEEAILAALNPADGTALFFVAKGDGSHQFSDTLEAHNRAVREYQLKRRQDYRSSPEAKK